VPRAINQNALPRFGLTQLRRSLGHHSRGNTDTRGAKKAKQQVEQIYRSREPRWRKQQDAYGADPGTNQVGKTDAKDAWDRHIPPPAVVEIQETEGQGLRDQPDHDRKLKMVKFGTRYTEVTSTKKRSDARSCEYGKLAQPNPTPAENRPLLQAGKQGGQTSTRSGCHFCFQTVTNTV
jgi:hypothetical protein